MKIIMLAFFGLFFASIATAAPLPIPTSSTQNLNSVVAIVNHEVITQTQLNKAVAAAKQQLAASQNPEAIDDVKLRKMVLNQLIDEKLIMQVAKRAKISVTDEQVTQAISGIATANHMTLSQLKQQLRAHNTNYDAYRKLITKQLIVHQVEQTAISGQIQITQKDLKDALVQYQSQPRAFQSFHVIDILNKTQEGAENIMAELKNGANIDTIAPKKTTDLGWQTAATLPTIFIDQISHMQPGDVAGPIQAPNGFHVIKLIDVRGGKTGTPTQEQLQNIAFQIQSQKAVQAWLKQLRNSAYVQITGE